MSKKKYIEVNALLDKIFPYGMVDSGNYVIQAKAVRVAIDSMATADVVEVVRCKDCKSCDVYYPRKEKGKAAEIAYHCELFEHATKPTDYCSHGERKCAE
jgi:hypothetical protein